MIGRSPLASRHTVAASVALAAAVVPAIAAAQYGPQPYGVPGQYAPPPGTQPIPYNQPYQPYQQQPPPGYSRWYTSQGSDDRDFMSDRAHSWPVLRVSAGAGTVLGPRLRPRLGFDLDVTAGYRWAFAKRGTLVMEAGYSFESEPTFGGHFGAIGLGPELYVGRYFSVGWAPKFVIGASWSGLSFGVRNTLVVPVLLNVFNFEVGHQWLREDAAHRDHHEVRAQIGVDLAAAVRLYAWLNYASAR